MNHHKSQQQRELIIYDGTCSLSNYSVFVSFSRIRVDAQKRNEFGYVWTRKVLNPQQNVCRYKRIRIRVDGASLSDPVGEGG